MVPCQLSWPRTFCTGGKPCRQQPLFPHEYTQTCAISSTNMVHKRRNGGSSGLQHFLKDPEQPHSDMRLFTYIKGAWAQLKLNNFSYLCGAVPEIVPKHQFWISQLLQNSHGDFEPLFVPSVGHFFPSATRQQHFETKLAQRRSTDEHNHCSVLTRAAVTVGAVCPELLSAFLHCLPLLLLGLRNTHCKHTHFL